MNKAILFVSCALFASCAQTKVPSVAPIRAAVSAAQDTTSRAQASATKAQASTTKAQANAKVATDKVVQLEKVVASQQNALQLAQDVHGQLDALSLELGHTQDALKDTQRDLEGTQGHLKDANKKVGEVEEELKKVRAALEAADRIRPKYYRLKYGVCFLAAGIAGGVMARFGKGLLVLGWIGIGVMIAAPVAVFTALMFIL